MYCDMTETKNIYAGMCSLTPVLMFAELLCSFNLLESECSDDIILIITLKLLFMSVKPTLKHSRKEVGQHRHVPPKTPSRYRGLIRRFQGLADEDTVVFDKVEGSEEA